MTESRDGFQRTVMVHLSRCYPSTREWLVALPNRHEVVEQWERELADYSPAELVAAIDFIRLGGMAAPPNYDRECWPVYLRQACGRLRARTQQRELFEQGGGLEK